MKSQRGFSVIELVMVMAISAILMTILLQIYNQVTRNMMRVERFVFEDTQILTLKNRFGKDLAGLSAIWFTQAELQAKQAAKDAVKAAEPTTEKKKCSKYFYSVNKNKHLDTLTFVTTSALQSYGSVQSRFVRVLYKVEKDPAYEGLLRLMRKEITMPTENIDEENLKFGNFYQLVGGIKSLEMTYQLVDKSALKKLESAKADKEKNKSTDQEEKQPIIRAVKQWTGDDGKKKESTSANAPADNNKKEAESSQEDASPEEDVSEDLGGATVPKFVEMKIVFGKTNKQLEKEYKLEFYIPSTLDNAPKGIVIQQAPQAKPTPE
jgi:prepilin-type N-terminal cleavage/methylation domain-containing protein